MNWTHIGEYVITIAIQVVFIFILYSIVKTIGKKLISRNFDRLRKQRNMSEGRSKTLESLTLNIFTYVLVFMLTTIIIGLFDYSIAPLIASAGIVGLAIGFGAQGLVSDIVTGF